MPTAASPFDAPADAPVALIGAGAVATVLGQRLVACGVPVVAVLSRRLPPAQALAERLGASTASTQWSDLPATARVLMLCVPDDAIAPVARGLSSVPHAQKASIVAHTSGALSSTALAPLTDSGVRTLSFHPVQTITRTSPPDVLEGIVVGVEGDPEAAAYGTWLATRLGATPVRLSADEKVRYHAAAVLASNGLVALAAAAHDVLSSVGLSQDTARQMLGPLIVQTAANLRTDAPAAVLTGPVVRGDAGTISAHRNALQDNIPHTCPLYDVLSDTMARLAAQSGRLTASQARQLRRLWGSTDEPDPTDDTP